ncbi:MAG: DUF1150 family protein [Rhodospirillales bacterium]|nr:DUF1150 family protein [Rhodospirillales bacterium]
MIQNPNTQAAVSRHMTITDFALFGAEHIAYVKPVVIEGQLLYAVFAADGRELAVIEGRDLADATVRQNDMEPLSVH